MKEEYLTFAEGESETEEELIHAMDGYVSPLEEDMVHELNQRLLN